jgi:hypothetical protein
MHLRLLRLFLGFAAFAWGISVVGVFLSWSAAAEALQGLGAQPIVYDRMLDYWLRMAAGAFALVGCCHPVVRWIDVGGGCHLARSRITALAAAVSVLR